MEIDQEFDVADILLRYAEKKTGATTNYQMLLRQLQDAHLVSSDVLVRYLRGFRQSVADLGREHEMLVAVLLNIDWTTHDSVVIKEYQTFVLHLVSAQTFYLTTCIEIIVDQFSLRTKTKDKTRRVKIGIEWDISARHVTQQSFFYLHQLLAAIVGIVPMTPVALIPLVHTYFPFVKGDAYPIECYVQNLFKMTTYVPSCRCEILSLVVERMICVDLSAPREQVQLAEEDNDTANEDLFLLDEVCGADVIVTQRSMHHKEGQKLDCLMDSFFTYVRDTCHEPVSNELNWDATRSLYRDMLIVFESILLPTHASSHVQFVMFYLCSLRQSLADNFIDCLWKKATNPNVETVYRQAAIAYISSFLARAKYLPISSVRTCIDRMSDWAHMYIGEVAYTSTKPDARYHGAFYAICQAIFYVFVFRHRSLLESTSGIRFCKSLNLPTIVSSRLNPLRICHPTVVNTFASVARATQVAFCDTIIERNRRCMLPEADTENGGTASARNNPLILYFPFDPYVLTRSSHFIAALYQEYEGCIQDDDHDSSDAVKMDEESELYTDGDDCKGNLFVAEVLTASNSLGNDKSYLEFFKHGRSPGFNRE